MTATPSNSINVSSVGIIGFNGISFDANALTQYELVVGGATSDTVSQIAVGTSGQLLQSAGSANPGWTTSTYPATNAVSTLLYASSSNTMAALSTANTAALVTNSTGVPSYTSSFTVPGSQLIFNGTSMVPFNPLQQATYFDDFLGYFQGADMLTVLGWKDTEENGGSVTFNTSSLIDSGHPGIMILNTGTTLNGGANVGLSYNGAVAPWILGGGTYDLYAVVKVPVLSTVLETFQIYVGLADDKGGPTNEQCWFTYTNALNSGDWVAQTRTGGGTVTSVNSSVAVGTSWTTLRINVNSSASTITFYVNGSSIGTSTTNIPVNGVGWYFEIIGSVGTQNRVFYADLFYGFINLTSAR